MLLFSSFSPSFLFITFLFRGATVRSLSFGILERRSSGAERSGAESSGRRGTMLSNFLLPELVSLRL